MCHCGRWFSRLDNLRQHSSTVHADEEIPSNSLAATGTRYQRHGRPERVRPRSRAQSQSDIQPPTEQQLQPTPPAALGSPMEDRRTRRRPDPIVVPQDAARDESAFNQYRDHTPPDSPASSVSTFRFGGGGVYRNRAAPYPAVAESPAATPTSSRIGSNSDSPFGSPGGYSHRGSVAYDGTSSSVAARRLSMPHPPTPSLFAAPPQVLPHLGYAGPAAAPASRRDSLTSVIADDRRRTWHMGTPVSVNFQRDIVSPTTQSFARTTIHSPTEPGHPPMPHSRPAHTDRLPSIHHVLQEFAPSTPEHQRSSWAGDTLERPGTSELKRPFHEGISAVSGRRVAPGQVRSSHGRSISNIETKGWGGGQSNPFSLGPWGGDTRDRREASLQPNTSLSVEGNNRHSGYFGGALSNIPSPREHRHSFGSSDSNVSEGLVTPVAPLRTQPRILGEPGDAVFHTEVRNPAVSSNYYYPSRFWKGRNRFTDLSQGPDKDYERSCEMTGVETTGQPPSTCNELMNAGNMEGHTTVPSNFPVSRLDALVSAAAVAAKI